MGTRPAVLRGWDPPAAPWARGHRGVDLAAAPGDAVRAAADGVVSFVGTVAGRGVVAVELPGTGDPPLRTTYEPVVAGVRRGDRVEAGAVLGELGPGPWHCAAGCLHWGLLRGREYLDPLGLLPGWMVRRGPSRLLPLSRPFAVSWAFRGFAARPQTPDRLIRPVRRLRTGGTPSGGARSALRGAGARPRKERRKGGSGGTPPGASAPNPAQRHPHRDSGDPLRLLHPELDPPDSRVHDALQHHRDEPRLLMPQSHQRVAHHGDQPTMRGPDLLPGGGVQLAGRDRDDGTVPPVPDQGQLPPDIRLDLRLGRLRLRHGGLDLGRPDGEVDGAQLLDDGRAGAEVLVDGGPSEPGALGEGGEGERFRTALGQQGAGGVQQGVALHRPVLGH
ncbi:peptidase [Streptomyces mobaraensis NBRC 13819 = DSM 40847]|uniref:Peptidase n=1 Tax=Streptomyces mobaraensis (strain ATCC 29032 / DSM 40847 / JCM 4168 / NBRC 13819 / NCIMB 11159 / IPCR 16-22) TaxID=1223523 RepID=M3BJZ8_STRM1|nr:peptidase [Streptomyces mobaraensis NBRC 13819 = DSM 40847]